MKKYLVTLMIACSALFALSGCVVSEEKLSDKVQQSMIDYEKAQGNELEVTDLKLDKAEGKVFWEGDDVSADRAVRNRLAREAGEAPAK